MAIGKKWLFYNVNYLQIPSFLKVWLFARSIITIIRFERVISFTDHIRYEVVLQVSHFVIKLTKI